MGTDADLVRQMAVEVFAKHNVDALDDFLADEFVTHDPRPGFPPTREGMRAIAAMVATAYSDREVEFREVLETTDGRVVTNWATNGIHTGAVLEIPPSGQRVRLRGIEIWRCSGGKIVEHWAAIDMSDVISKAQASPG